MAKQYYSIRTGKNKNFSGFDLSVLKKLFSDLYSELDTDGYFQEYFGFECTDVGFVRGILGENIEAQIYRLLRKDNLWPIKDHVKDYEEDDLFDIIEFLYDHISKPIETKGAYHSFNQCGWHYSKFERDSGKKEFQEEINGILSEYGLGFQMDSEGLILTKDESGLATIYTADIPTKRDDIRQKMNLAIQKYRQSRSSLEERRIAIRELADILEALKADAKKYLDNKDEGDLFNIANNFSIRHVNEKQKNNYDKDIWYSWIFYFYVATIHALLRIKERAESNKK